MGTSYTLIDNDKGIVEVDEMSNRLSLTVSDGMGDYKSTGMMEPVKMLKLFMEGIKATSYWMDEATFNEVFSKLEKYPY